MTENPDDQREPGWEEARHSERDAPHEEQEPGSLEEPDTLHQPHEGEEGQSENAA
jgi:hypothetical protein